MAETSIATTADGSGADENSNSAGIFLLTIGLAIFTIQDVIIKWLSPDFSIAQIVFIRSVVGVPLLFLVVMFGAAKNHSVAIDRPWLNLLRATMAFGAYISYFLAIAAMPLADAVAIAFAAPLVITLLSALFLGEDVGIRRWTGVIVGFIGVLVIARPGANGFEPAALLAVACAVFYGITQSLARVLGRSTTSGVMSLFAAIIYLAMAGIAGAVLGSGWAEPVPGTAHPSVEFLLKGWVMPEPLPLALMALTGVISAAGFYLLAKAYSVAESSVVAPFEYTGLIWAALLGVVIFGEVPDAMSLLGMALVVGSGLYVILRERQRGAPLVSKRGRLRMRLGW